MRDVRDGRLLTLLACAAVVGFGVATCGTEDGPESFDASRDSIAAAVALRLHRQADSLAKQYRVDTVTIRKTRTRTDTLLLRDTLIHRDTVRVYLERERLACDAALSTCERRVATADSLRRIDSLALADLRKRQPSAWAIRWRRLRDLTVGAAAGVLVGTLR